MARPNNSQVRIDRLLSNVSIGMMQNPNNFIFNKVFPIIPVEDQSAKYIVYDTDDWNTDEARVRKDSQESSGSGYNLSMDNYNCKVFAFHKDVGDQLADNAKGNIDLYTDATKFVTQKLMLRQELSWAEAYLTSGVWGDTQVGTTDFDKFDEDTSTPIEFFSGEVVDMAEIGIEPNMLVMGYDLFNTLKNHADFVDRIKYSMPDAISADIMAKLIGVDKILVSKSVKATGKGETKTRSYTFGNSALLVYAAPAPGKLTPSGGYTFSWNYAGIGAVGIKRFYIQEKETTRIEGSVAFDSKVTAKDIGRLYTSCIS